MRFALLLACLLALAGCGDSPEPLPSALTGLIVEIEGAGSDVEAFTLEDAASGDTYEIRIDPDVDYGFDLAHLHEHLNEELPVRCTLEEREGELYALEIADA